MKKFLVWIWCFPQMLAGAIWVKISKARKADGYCIVSDKYEYSMSLGEYIFLCESHVDDPDTLKHERGHTKQSYIFGWFYLLCAGLPSALWARLGKKYREKHGIDYYSVYPENWADKLGGVKR